MKKRNIVAIIPARMGSTRFPGKPMAKLLGKPMIGHVYERVSRSDKLGAVVVATCDEEIFSYIESIGGMAVLTSPKHERAVDRCAEALPVIEDILNIEFDIAVMVQGDEPMIEVDMINEALCPMLDDLDVGVVNLYAFIKDESEFKDPNCIKVVVDNNLNALFFSRQPIPTNNHHDTMLPKKQVCVIPMTKKYLLAFSKLGQGSLEKAESVDMMRFIENGMKVKMALTKFDTHSVDTLDDLKLVEGLIAKS